MKNNPTDLSKKFHFLKDKDHIYNKLVGIPYVDMGWKKLVFTLDENITYEGTICDGLTLLDESQIKLDITLSSERAHSTVIHEVLHCITNLVGVDNDYDNHKELKLTNEEIVTNLTKGFILFKRLNPKLSKLLFSE